MGGYVVANLYSLGQYSKGKQSAKQRVDEVRERKQAEKDAAAAAANATNAANGVH